MCCENKYQCDPECDLNCLEKLMEKIEDELDSWDPDYDTIFKSIKQAKEMTKGLETVLNWTNLKLNVWETRSLNNCDL